ncbi:MAG: hypothetical protein WCA49_15300 [Candidatus Sulfotelmatobacter sp.]
MKMRITKMVLWMGLLVLLLGANHANLVAGGPGTVPDPPRSGDDMSHSPNWLVASGGTMPLPPPPPPGSRVTVSIVS